LDAHTVESIDEPSLLCEIFLSIELQAEFNVSVWWYFVW